MSQRFALVVATVLTVFMLVVMSSVFSQVSQRASAIAPTTVPTVAPPPTASPTAIIDLALMNQFAQRESDYQKLLQQANEQLKQANEQLQQVYEPPAQPAKQVAPAIPTQAPPAVAAPPKYAVTADQAAGIALKSATGAKLMREPELVSFEGKAAYEVTLDRGSIYVDATSGQVLFDGTTEPQANSDSGGGSGQNAGPASPSSHTDKEDNHKDGNDKGGDHESNQGGSD